MTQGTVGEGDHEVEQGECITSIAAAFGHLTKMIWDVPANTPLADADRKENILLEGDLVTIPEVRRKEETCQSGMRHRFVFGDEQVVITLRLLHVPLWDSGEVGEGDEDGGCGHHDSDEDIVYDDEGGDEPGDEEEEEEERVEALASQPFELTLDDGSRHEGTTDPDGYLTVPISPTCKQAVVLVGEEADQLRFEFDLGHLDPIRELSGVQQRLNNIGFWCGEVDGYLGSRTKQALRMFQDHHHDLEPTSQVDDRTRQRLEEEHGS